MKLMEKGKGQNEHHEVPHCGKHLPLSLPVFRCTAFPGKLYSNKYLLLLKVAVRTYLKNL